MFHAVVTHLEMHSAVLLFPLSFFRTLPAPTQLLTGSALMVGARPMVLGISVAALRARFNAKCHAGFAVTTVAAINSRVRRYFMFCSLCDIIPFPATFDSLGMYLCWYTIAHRVTSLANIVTSLRRYHEHEDAEFFPDASKRCAIKLSHLRRALKRDDRRGSLGKAAIGSSILFSLRQRIDFRSVHQLQLWANILLAYNGLLRISEHADGALCWGDITFFADHLSIRIRHDKTNQFGPPVYVVVGRRSDGLCAYEALVRLHDAFFSSSSASSQRDSIFTSSAPPDEPLFCRLTASGVRRSSYPVSRSRFVSGLRLLLGEAGFEVALFGSHSLRSGFATDALDAGVDPKTLMLLGRWSSASFLIYWRPSKSVSISAAQHVADYFRRSAVPGNVGETGAHRAATSQYDADGVRASFAATLPRDQARSASNLRRVFVG
jgi:integrase